MGSPDLELLWLLPDKDNENRMIRKHLLLQSILTPLMCVLLIAAGAAVFLIPSKTAVSNPAALASGISYMKELELQDVSSVDQELRLRVSMEALEGMSTWEKLDYFDTYIMGDSRTALFTWSGMNPDHIWAESSTTIKWVEEKLDLIASVRPGNLVLSFGMNDMGMYEFDPYDYWETAEDYVEACQYYIDLIREVSPETNIYINSIIPVQESGIERQPRWVMVPEWNAALREFCASYGVGFIDVDYLAYVYADDFQEDGVHFYVQAALEDWGDSILEVVEQTEFGV